MSWTYRPALDGLRSVAVYLVLLFHTGLAGVEGGFIGVDLFFALSGFLVTNVILSEMDATGRLDLGGFYARRVRRLLPAALVVVVSTTLVFLLVAPLVRRLPLVGDAQSALLYAANWNFLLKQEDYFASDVAESPFLHFWSLAIEEQFYFVFPVVLLLLVRAARRRAWVLPATLGALLAASLVSQLVWARINMNWAYYGTDARLYQLLAGALLAVVLRRVHLRPPTRVANLVAVFALGALLAVGSGLLDVSPSVRGIVATAASVTVIGALMVAEDGPLARLLSQGTLVYLGKVSYGTYLWHWPVILVLHKILAVGPLTVAAIATVLSTGLAALSFEVLETPIRKTPTLHPFRWRTVLVGVTTSALIAATVVPAVLDSQRRPRLVASSASAAPVTVAVNPAVSVEQRNAAVPADLDWRKLTANTRDLPACTKKDPHACVLVEGKGPHVTLIGDSHAKVLVDMFEKLAEEHDLTFSVNVVPGCPWQMGVVDNKLSKPRTEKCLAAREDWYENVLPALDPDLVVFSGLSRDDEDRWDGRLVRIAGPADEPLPELLFTTARETVELVREQGPAVLLLSTMPVMRDGEEPLDCLARAQRLHQCEFELPPRPPSDAYNRVTAALVDQVYFADITEAFCTGAPRCLPIVDGVVVWHDSMHFSAEFAVHERGKIWRRIKESGAFEKL